MKIGVIGLGDIAMKAYLPVMASMENLEIHLYTRNRENLNRTGSQYRIQNLHNSLDSLIASGIKAAFVHVATEAHFQIVKKLLENDVHVYVDKPVTYELQSTKLLIALAKERNLILMAGFNRRYAPTYKNLKEVSEPNMVLMQKNRKALPGMPRKFIFDDFIHVVDTLTFLFPYPIEKMDVTGKIKDHLLFHVVVKFTAKDGAVAMGIMNRDSGTTEEKVEIFSSLEKRVVYDVSSVETVHDNRVIKVKPNDWEATLSKRGFVGIVEDFIRSVSQGESPQVSLEEILLTHTLCEQIVLALEGENRA